LMVVLVVVAALLVVPLLQAQLVDFAGRVPGYLERCASRLRHCWCWPRNG
jgi:hypothetical protein